MKPTIEGGSNGTSLLNLVTTAKAGYNGIFVFSHNSFLNQEGLGPPLSTFKTTRYEKDKLF